VSEDRQGVERRAGAADDRDRVDHQLELPTLQTGGNFCEPLEILIVENVDPERRDHQRVNRKVDAGNSRGHHLGRRIAASKRHVTGSQPRGNRRVETGGALSDGPGSRLLATGPTSRAEQHRVAGTHLHTGLFLPRFDVLLIHRCPRLQIGHTLQPRDVQQHAARDDALLEVVDRELRAPLLGVHIGTRVAVVGLILVEDVTQRVEVAVRVSVVRDAVGVSGKPAVHRVLERACVVLRAFGQRIVSQ